ncbi:MAG: HEAT repeat domain-containing protein, partial [Phycisphaerales bacterium]
SLDLGSAAAVANATGFEVEIEDIGLAGERADLAQERDIRGSAVTAPPVETTDGLVQRLKSKDAGERRKAAERLGELANAGGVEALVGALKDEEVGVRSAAARALGKIGDKRAVDPLVETYRDQEYESFVDAIWALGDIGGEKAERTLIEALSYDGYHPYVRNIAAKCLRKLGWEPEGRGQKALYLIALEEWDKAVEAGPAARVSPRGPNVVEGAVELAIPIVVPLKAEEQKPAIMRYPVLRFSKAGGRLRAMLNLRCTSWPHTKWLMRLEILDADNKVLGSTAAIHANSGTIEKYPLVEYARIAFDFGGLPDAAGAARFRLSFESFHTERSCRLDLGRQIPLALELNAAEWSKTLTAQWVKFEESAGRMLGTVHVRYLSWPKAKWEIALGRHDERGEFVGSAQVIENSGLILGLPSVTEKDLEFSLGAFDKLPAGGRMVVKLRRIPEPKAADVAGEAISGVQSGRAGPAPAVREAALIPGGGAAAQWEDLGEAIPADCNTTRVLAEGIVLEQIGEDSEGKVYVTCTRDAMKAKDLLYRFILIKNDGSVLEPSGYGAIALGPSERLWEKFSFETGFVRWRLKEFRFQSSALPTSGSEVPPERVDYRDALEVEPPFSSAPPPGRYGLHFDGEGDYLLIADSPSLRLKGPFTVEAWIRAEVGDEPPHNRPGWGLMAKGCWFDGPKARIRGFGVSVDHPASGSSGLLVHFCTGSDEGIHGYTVGGYEVRDGVSEWIHVSNVFNCLPADGHPLVVGRYMIPSEEPFRGQVGEIRIWNRALTRQEVRRYEKVALTGREPGLVGCWPFEQTDGQFAYDIGPNRNHGRLGSTTGTDDADPEWVSLSAEPAGQASAR